MNNPKQTFKLIRTVDFIDSVCLFIGAFGLISSFIQEKHWFTLFCIGWLAIIIYGIKNGKVKLESKFDIEDRNLYEIIDENNNHSYLLGSSIEEIELLMQIDQIRGKPNYIGKVKYIK